MATRSRSRCHPRSGPGSSCTRRRRSNLVAGDTNGKQDVFLFDRITNTTERVSVGVGGRARATATSVRARHRARTRRYVAFVSAASNLVAGDTNGKADVFVRDRVAGTTTLVSRASGCEWCGRRMVIRSRCRCRTTVGTWRSRRRRRIWWRANEQRSPDVFVRDTVANTTERVSVGFVGEGTGGSTSPQISADGRFVAFDSDADDLVPNDDNLSYDVFVRDRVSGSTERVSVGPNGEQGEDDSTDPSMSRDGRYIAFESAAEEFSANDGNISLDAYVRDRLARNTVRVEREAERPRRLRRRRGRRDLTRGSVRRVRHRLRGVTTSRATPTTTTTSTSRTSTPSTRATRTKGSRFQGVAPKRLLDTRTNGAKLNGPTDARPAGGGRLDRHTGRRHRRGPERHLDRGHHRHRATSRSGRRAASTPAPRASTSNRVRPCRTS